MKCRFAASLVLLLGLALNNCWCGAAGPPKPPKAAVVTPNAPPKVADGDADLNLKD